MIKHQKYLFLFGAAFMAVFIIIISLFYYGIFHFNNPSIEKYPIQGVDVSSYQGEIDWDILSAQNITFAFIKATEGSSYADEFFPKNWTEASKTNLYVGAYHFFSFESKGKTQAENYISTVGEIKQLNLPPIIDVEYYDYKDDVDDSSETIRHEIQDMIQTLKDHYGEYPILYVDKKTYEDFVKDNFAQCPIWVRSVYGKPNYIENDEWTFWQYSNRHRLDGYNGKERYIDMNVYNGNIDDFIREFSLK